MTNEDNELSIHLFQKSKSIIAAILASCTFIFCEIGCADGVLVKTTIAYKEVNGHQILVDIHRPNDAVIRPVIVNIHGGALIMGYRDLDTPELREFLAQNPDYAYFDLLGFARDEGYAVASIDYRLAPETKLPEIIADIEDAFRWLASKGATQFHLDPDRIVVFGSSAGGYLTLVTGFRVAPKPKALVSFYGYGDLDGDWYSTPSPHPGHNEQSISLNEALDQTDGTTISDSRQRKGDGELIYLSYRQHGLWPQEVSGFNPSAISERILPFEPLENVNSSFPPTLLVHGTEDTDVPFEQSKMMAAELERHAVPYFLRPIHGGEHEFMDGDPQEIRAAYEFTKSFINQHLK